MCFYTVKPFNGFKEFSLFWEFVNIGLTIRTLVISKKVVKITCPEIDHLLIPFVARSLLHGIILFIYPLLICLLMFGNGSPSPLPSIVYPTSVRSNNFCSGSQSAYELFHQLVVPLVQSQRGHALVFVKR